MAYIDPITGAYVADGLEALPPGYNQPKAGNEAQVAKMRAALNNSWDDNTPLPDIPSGKSISPTDLIKHAYQNMPGAGIPQATIAALSDMFGGTVGNIYGVGKQALSGELGNADAGNRAFADAQKLAQLFHYNPPTKAGQDIYNVYNKVGEATGPLPELWNTNARFTPDDLRALFKTGVEDVRNFPMDYANAREGLTRDYPTMGSRAAEFTDLSANMARPLAEKAYDMYMNPQSSVEVSGLKPGANLTGLFEAGSPMYAVKPKGGNWPTNLGSTNRLSEQGVLGQHLSKVQHNDPMAVFQQQLEKHHERGIDNRELLHEWEKFLHEYYTNNANGIKYSDLSGAPMEALKKEAADAFVQKFNAENPDGKKLHTASQIAEALPHYNAWVMGPYQKYITNQMGTGLETDPLLQAVNEGGMPPYEIFGQERPRDYEIDSLQRNADSVRNNFFNTMYGYSDSPKKQEALQNTSLGKVTATTPEGIAYENALDASLYPKGPYAFKDPNGGTTEFPVVGKLDRNALISDFLTGPEKQTGFTSIRKQMFQDLLAGNLDPAKLSNVTPATITRQMIKDKMAEFKEHQLSKKGAAEWIPKRAAAMPTDTAFPDGSKMTIITPEMANADEAMTARDLGQITIDLNQCVGAGCHATQDYPGHGPWLVPHTGKPPRGKVEPDKYGYLKRLKNGDIEIASLKDPEGVSQATLELKLEKPKPIPNHQKESTVGFWLEDNKTPEDVANFYENKVAFGIDVATKMAVEEFPELKTKLENAYGTVKKSIQQIKGHSNNEIKEEYVPHVVEWLNQNAANLSDVREISHLPNAHDLDNPYNSISKLVDDRQHWYSPTVEEFFKKADDERLLPRFFTTDEFAQLATQHGVDLSAEPKNDVVNDGVLTDQEIAKRQKYYETVSQELRNTFTDTYLQDAFNGGDNAALRQLVRELEDRPTGYFLGSPSPGTRQAVINRLRNQGLHTPGEELENVAQEFEPEVPQQFDRLTDLQLSVLDENMQNYFAGAEHLVPEDMVEPYATDTRILMGSQEPETQLPRTLHRHLVDLLLDQDQHTADIRDLIDRLQQNNHFMTEPQAENMLNMLISWTERYPLAE